MNTELTTHTFNHSTLLRGIDIRVVQIDGEPWFVAADICKEMGIRNTTDATRHLDPNECQHVSRSKLDSIEISFPNRGATCVSESGLYGLINQSRKPFAKEFQRWVRQEVLPSIRKTGGYIAGQEKVATGELSDREFLARAVQLVEACQRLAEISGSRLGMKAAIGAGEGRLAGIRSD